MSGIGSLLLEVEQQTPHHMKSRAIVQELAREKMREILRQKTLESWNDYQATGLHVTAEEAIAWLETWGDEDELPAPECHP